MSTTFAFLLPHDCGDKKLLVDESKQLIKQGRKVQINLQLDVFEIINTKNLLGLNHF